MNTADDGIHSSGYDEHGITQVVEFAYAEVEAHLDGDKTPEAALEAAMELERRLNEWTYQAPCADVDGFLCRSIVRAWIFVPMLRSYTMTEIAGRFGKKKQSLGRWVDQFKRDFPEIKHLKHMRME